MAIIKMGIGESSKRNNEKIVITKALKLNQFKKNFRAKLVQISIDSDISHKKSIENSKKLVLKGFNHG